MKKLIEEAVKWTMSPEGKCKIKEAFERAEETSRKFREDSYIAPNDPRLFEPMII